MIKISSPNLDQIAYAYSQKIIPICKERSKYAKIILEVIAGNRPQTALNSTLHGLTRKSLCNFFLENNKMTVIAEIANVTSINAYAWVMTENVGLIAMLEYLSIDDNLKEIVLCRPLDTVNLDNNLKTQFGILPTNEESFFELIKIVMNYDLFRNYSYRIAADIGINTCPYCNRNHIHTVIDENDNDIIRPTFDHFFSQARHPLFALSFFNLIPSCYYCNSNLKGNAPMHIDSHIHPYHEDFGDHGTFHVLISSLRPNKSDPDNYSLSIINNVSEHSSKHIKIFGDTAGGGNIELFQLKSIYKSHLDTVGELIMKCDRLSLKYANSLSGLLENLGSDKGEFYRFYFSNYLDEKDLHKRPLSKLSKDIIKQVLPQKIKSIILDI